MRVKNFKEKTSLLSSTFLPFRPVNISKLACEFLPFALGGAEGTKHTLLCSLFTDHLSHFVTANDTAISHCKNYHSVTSFILIINTVQFSNSEHRDHELIYHTERFTCICYRVLHK
jgi:hypothetical protein